MKPSQIPTALRELADRFEALGLQDGDDETAEQAPRATISVNVHHVDTRDALAKIVSLMDKPHLNTEVPCVDDGHSWQTGIRIAAFYEPGLLGGERKEVVVDSEAGLAALVAEYPAAEETVTA